MNNHKYGEDVDKKEFYIYTTSDNVYTKLACMDISMEILQKKKKLEIELPYDQAISHLGAYPKQFQVNVPREYTGTSMSIAALLTIAKLWDQPVSSIRGMKKMC